ncbi:MAG: hypothetical protein K9M82_06560 [Deltaproteobacteria bacterium]|nr:hypothetical protein [Deltaproteobacteria bacterium]
MKDKIKVLIELQNCDNRIQSLLTRKKKGPSRIQALSDEMEAVSKGFQEDEERLDTIKSERRSLEQEVEDLDAKIQKGNEKLSNIKSNKEYSAALKEIEGYKKKKALLEDQLIQQMEELELVKERCRANSEQLETLQQQFEKDKKEVQDELVEIEKELTALEKERTAIARKADPQLLRHYELVRERIGSHAVSPVIGGVCKTCNMGIPPQMFNELMKCLELTSCPHCNRIIYWGDDAQFQELTNP